MPTNYEKQDVAQPGQMYDTSNNLIISVENTNDTLQFGDFVVNDSGSIVKWNSDDYANKKPVGVVLYNALEIEGKPSDKSKIPLISRGTVWVLVDDTDGGFANVKKGSIAYLNTVSGEPTGFIDDVITNQKIGVFLEDPSALNEGGHIAAIELKLFAKNTNNLIVIESGNDDPPLPPSGSIIYYNEPDDSLRSSSATGYSYLNPKPHYESSVYNDINPINNTIGAQFNDFMVQRSNLNASSLHLMDRFSEFANPDTYNGVEFTGKYPINCQVFITISCVLKNASNEAIIAIQAASSSGAGGNVVPIASSGITASRFYMNLKPDQEVTFNTSFVTSLDPSNNKFFIQAANAIGITELDVDVTGYNIICLAI